MSFVLHADISEPDNLLYGTIVIGTNAVTAARTDVVVEARRTPTGPPVASYRMGDDSSLGNFYRLRVPVEASAPLSNTNSSVAGTALYLVLRDASGVQAQAAFTIIERGAVQQVNFGVAVSDSDGNGLPDAWEIAHLGGIAQNPNADPDGDGQTNLQEWIAGTDPLDANDAFHLTINPGVGQVEVSFLAFRAEGSGYENKNRYYSLQSGTNVATGPWLDLAGFVNLPGANQFVNFRTTVSATNQPVFYRGTVRLQ